MAQKEERQALIDELSKVENKHTGEYAIAEKPFNWQNSGAIADYILAKYISKDKLLKTRPARKSVKPSLTKMSLEDRFADLRHEGYNQALKDWSKALGMEEQND